MNVLFTIYGLNQAPANAKNQYLFDEKGGFIGRSEECEWPLIDKSKKISRKHAHITYENGNFYIADISSNGIFQALHHTPLVKGSLHKIENGEGFIIGDFSIKASLMQAPSSYAEPVEHYTNDFQNITEADPFSLNPLQAMDQEEEIMLNQRLGDTEDYLIIQKEDIPPVQPDNISVMHSQINVSPVNMETQRQKNFIPEDWDEELTEETGLDINISADTDTGTSIPNADASTIAYTDFQEKILENLPSDNIEDAPQGIPHELSELPEDLIAKPTIENNISPNTLEENDDISLEKIIQKQHEQKNTTNNHENVLNSNQNIGSDVNVTMIDNFLKQIGCHSLPNDNKKREETLKLVGQLFIAMTEGLTQAMQHRAEVKNELRLPITLTSLNIQNNPLKYSPTAEAARSVLLGEKQKGVMDSTQAIYEAFHDLHKHHLGLLAGTRATVQGLLDKLAPELVDAYLEANNAPKFFKDKKRWIAFKRLHQELQNDQEKFAALFIQDFARAYEMQGKTLNPTHSNNSN